MSEGIIIIINIIIISEGYLSGHIVREGNM